MSVRDLVILGTSSQQPTRFRNHGAYLIRWNDEGFLFDPGEGTQRQFIFANIAPPVVTRIFVSHFHGDHCLGLGSILMRLNLDQVTHPIHCYYPASGKKFFDRLRYGTIYHENIHVIEHPVYKEGIVEEGDNFRIEAVFLDHGVDNIGWRITEKDQRKFDNAKLKSFGIQGPLVRKLIEEGSIEADGRKVDIDEVSWIRKGDSIAVVIDTKMCDEAVAISKDALILLCESTYLETERDLAERNNHLTAKQAAEIAKKANVKKLVLTHYSARYLDEKVFEIEAREVFPNTVAAKDMMYIPFPKNPPEKKSEG